MSALRSSGRAREPVVIKLSGSFVQPANVERIRVYATVLRELWEEKLYRPLVVVGGGGAARSYVEAGRALGAPEAELDLMGAEVARLNAKLLALALGRAALREVPRNVDQLLEALGDPAERIVVLGGLQPGQSTNAVAAVVAELVGARTLINATKVPGVYDKDPRKFADAKLLRQVRASEIARMLTRELNHRAGTYELFDLTALNIVVRSKITVYVVDGSDPQNIVKVLSGEPIGTLVIPE